MIYLLPIISAILLWLSVYQPAVNWLVWLSLVPLLIFLKFFQLRKRNFLWLGLFGWVYFGLFFSWLPSVQEWAGPVIYAGLAGMAFYQGLFYLVAAFLTYFFLRKMPLSFFTVATSSTWVFMEWLRALGPTGTSLGHPALGLYQNLLLLKLASFTGMHGVMFLVFVVNLLIYSALDRIFFKELNFRMLGPVFYLLLIGLAFWSGEKYLLKPEVVDYSVGGSLVVAGIQPNINQRDRLNQDMLEANFYRHINMSEQVKISAGLVDLVVWPEALPMILDVYQPYYRTICDLARNLNCALLVGSFTQEKNKTTGALELFNSALLFSAKGVIKDTYRKHQPVPFGEFLPIRQIFYPFVRDTGFFERDQASGPLKTLAWTSRGRRQVENRRDLGVLICFESTFSGLAQELAAQGATVFFVLTNDAWFGNSPAARYHIMYLPFRAAETGRYFLQVANTGISGLVGPDGQIISTTQLNSQMILINRIPLLTKKTFYVHYGDWIVYLSLFFMILGLLAVF